MSDNSKYPDLQYYGKYRMGLTSEEIKEYLNSEEFQKNLEQLKEIREIPELQQKKIKKMEKRIKELEKRLRDLEENQ